MRRKPYVGTRAARLLLAAALGTGGLAIVAGLGGVTATAAGAAVPAALAPQLQTPKTPTPQTSTSPHIGQTAPAVSSTPEIAPLTASSVTYTVDTAVDNIATASVSPADCGSAQTTPTCTLRAAITLANKDAGLVDVVDVPGSVGTIYLSDASGFGTIDVTNSMHIVGAGASTTIVDGQRNMELLDVSGSSPTPAVLISGMTWENGNAPDGGIIYLGGSGVGGALTLEGVTVTGGTASSDGGDIYVDEYSALWTDAGTVISNGTAEYGGGVYLYYSPMSVNGSTLSGNTASSEGGAVYNDGAYSAQNATYSNNGSPDGGAFYNDWTMSDTGGTYSGNYVSSTSDGYAAVLDNEDLASLSGATITKSSSQVSSELEGGVFYTYEGLLSLSNVSVSDTTNNCADCDIYGGVIYSDDYYSSLQVQGLRVSNTANGGAGSTAYIEGGVLCEYGSGSYSYDHPSASVLGFVVSATTNTAIDDDIYGGVVYDEGNQLTMTGAQISGTTNTATQSSGYIEGGVIDNENATEYLTGMAISSTSDTIGNYELYGGAVYEYADSSWADALSGVSIDGTTVTATGASDLYGGALYTDTYSNVSDVSITNTAVSNVGAGDGYVEGGGWYNGDEATANNVQVLGTTVTADYEVYGGAFSNDGDATTLTNSTFGGTTVTLTGNGDAYGGVAYFDNPVVTTNVTMDDSTTTVPNGADASVIYAYESSIQFTNDTIANDTVQAASGSLSQYSGGIAVDDSVETETFKNTIVATTPAATNCNLGGSTSAAFVSAGGNIDSGTSCGFGESTDQSSTNPMVATVADNGGPVQTAALLPGSPAIGAGVSAGAPATDARGVPRTAGNIDVGAYQTPSQGYWEVGSDGGIFAFGAAHYYGSMGGIPLAAPVVSMAPTPDQGGYWEVAADGGIFSFGDAGFYGSMGGIKLNAPIVGMASTPDGMGYWEVAADGGVFAFGDATYNGSMGGKSLNAPIVGMAATPDGGGYWLVAKDGGIFAFGDAGFYKSMGGQTLNAPVVGMAASPDGGGYWEVAADGGIFAFGDAGFCGSMGGKPLAKPMAGMADLPNGAGYWEFAADGGVFNFGTAQYLGSEGGTSLNAPIVGGAGFGLRTS